MPKNITRVRWSASSLPWGVSFDEQTGTFSGTPDTAGEYTVPVTVETNYGKDTKDVLITVAENVDWVELSGANAEGVAWNSREFQGGQPLMVGLYGNGTTPVETLVPYVCYTSAGYRQRPVVNSNYEKETGVMAFEDMSGVVYAVSDKGYTVNIYGLVKDCGRFLYLIGRNEEQRILRLNPDTKLFVPPYPTEDWNAACYSSSVSAQQSIYYFSKDGTAVRIKQPLSGAAAMDTTYQQSIGITKVNPNCAAYSPISGKMCVSSSNNMVATSYDGVTWETASTPDNFVQLSYHDDLYKFFARGETTKLLYVSDDGMTWTPLNSTPIPLKTVNTIAYSRAHEAYCVVGEMDDGATNYSLHSTDLENWTKKKITADESLKFKSVVYVGGGINAFVTVPVSGGKSIYVFKNFS